MLFLNIKERVLKSEKQEIKDLKRCVSELIKRKLVSLCFKLIIYITRKDLAITKS